MSIFLDFDGTITVEDTVGELAKFALQFQKHAASSSSSSSNNNNGSSIPADDDDDGGSSKTGASTGADLEAQWDALVRAYAADRRARSEAYLPAAPDRRTPAAEAGFLRALKPVEARSLARVRGCGLFRGVGARALRAAGAALVRSGRVRLRPGFAELARRCADAAGGWRVHVVSVNWSAAFIEGACAEGVGEGVRVRVDGDGGGDGGGGITVLANEVREEDGAVRGPGILNPGGQGGGEGDGDGDGRNLTNSCDKLEVVRAVLRREGGEGGPSFYFGDSTTDLECLLAVSRGFVIADAEDGSPLLETLRRIGMEVPRLRDAPGWEGLAWATDFDEVMANVKF